MVEIVAARLGYGWGWDPGEDNWNGGVDENFRETDTLMGLTVIDDTLTAPPGSPADGDTYIPHATATGAWATHEGKIAAFQAGTWYFYPVVKGLRALFATTSSFKYYTGSVWANEPVSIANLGTVADKRILANISGGAATLSAVSLTALLDDIISANHGAIITRGTADWEAITAGTSGFALVSQGTTDIPAWTSLAAVVPQQWLAGTVSAINANELEIGAGNTLQLITGPTIAVTASTNPVILNGNSALPGSLPTGTELDIVGAPATDVVELIDTFGTTTVGKRAFRKARGTVASPTAVQANDPIGGIYSAGYGTAYTAPVLTWNVVAAENWTGSAQGTYQTWSTTQIGSVAATERMRLLDSGIVLVGTTAASGTNKVQVIGGLSTDSININATGSISALNTDQFAINTGTLGIKNGATIAAVNSGATITPVTINGNTAVPAALATAALFQIIGKDGAINNFDFRSFGNANRFTGARADGTQASPTALLANEALFQISGMGYNGTVYTASVDMLFQANENWSGSTRGSKMTFRSTGTAGGSMTSKLQIGNVVLVNTTTGTEAATGEALQVGNGLLADNVRVTGTLNAFPLTRGLHLNNGSIEAKGTLTYSPTAAGTVTIAPVSGISDVIVVLPGTSIAAVLALTVDYVHQDFRLQIKQGATASTCTLNTGFVFAASGGPTSFTLTASANARDVLGCLAVDGTHAVVGAVLQGITI